MHQKLMKEGYHCEEAGSSDEALDKMMTFSADLVMLDLKMPGKSGMELLPELKTKYPQLQWLWRQQLLKPILQSSV